MTSVLVPQIYSAKDQRFTPPGSAPVPPRPGIRATDILREISALRATHRPVFRVFPLYRGGKIAPLAISLNELLATQIRNVCFLTNLYWLFRRWSRRWHLSFFTSIHVWNNHALALLTCSRYHIILPGTTQPNHVRNYFSLEEKLSPSDMCRCSFLPHNRCGLFLYVTWKLKRLQFHTIIRQRTPS